MSGIKQPVTQVRLTNVAVVRYRAFGLRFEIACYKNSVLAWRDGVEKDIDEVLQSKHVFSNVSKGVLANRDDLIRAFGTDNEEFVCRRILDAGDVQVSEKERAAHLESLFKDVAAHVADVSVNPTTQRPYPQRMIESAMKVAHIAVRPNKSAKSQANAVIRALRRTDALPIRRAEMRVQVKAPTINDLANTLKRIIATAIADGIARTDTTSDANNGVSGEWSASLIIDPSAFRALDERIREATRGRCAVDIIDFKVTDDDDADSDDDADGGRDHAHDEADDDVEEAVHAPTINATADAALAARMNRLRVSTDPSPSVSAAAIARDSAPVKSRKARRREVDAEGRSYSRRTAQCG